MIDLGFDDVVSQRRFAGDEDVVADDDAGLGVAVPAGAVVAEREELLEERLRVTDPEQLSSALAEALENTDCPSVLDVVVTRDPGKMLPAADNRTLKVEKGDRPV